MNVRHHRRARHVAALLAGLALVAASCGGDDGGASSDETTSQEDAATSTAASSDSTAASTSEGASDTTSASSETSTAGATELTPSGPADPSLDKVKIGYINQEAGSSGAYPEAWNAAKAAVDYINAELGGVGGHEIELVKCVTDGTPASSQSCAEQMVNDNVLFVSGGSDGTRESWYSILGPAGVPVVGSVPLTGADFNQDNAFFFIGGGAVVYPAQAAYIIENRPEVKSVGILVNDVPGALAALPTLKTPLEAAGLEVTDVQVPTTQTDWLAPFASIRDLDFVIANIVSTHCAPFAQARESQGSDLPVLTTSSCVQQQIIDAAGADAIEGWLVNFYLENPFGDTPDAELYRTVMETYAPEGAQLTGFAATSFADTITWYSNVLLKLGYDNLTSEAVTTTLRDPAGGKVFMGPNYDCASEGPYPAICNYSVRFYEIHDGKLGDAASDFVDARSYITAS